MSARKISIPPSHGHTRKARQKLYNKKQTGRAPANRRQRPRHQGKGSCPKAQLGAPVARTGFTQNKRQAHQWEQAPRPFMLITVFCHERYAGQRVVKVLTRPVWAVQAGKSF